MGLLDRASTSANPSSVNGLLELGARTAIDPSHPEESVHVTSEPSPWPASRSHAYAPATKSCDTSPWASRPMISASCSNRYCATSGRGVNPVPQPRAPHGCRPAGTSQCRTTPAGGPSRSSDAHYVQRELVVASIACGPNNKLARAGYRDGLVREGAPCRQDRDVRLCLRQSQERRRSHTHNRRGCQLGARCLSWLSHVRLSPPRAVEFRVRARKEGIGGYQTAALPKTPRPQCG